MPSIVLLKVVLVQFHNLDSEPNSFDLKNGNTPWTSISSTSIS